MNRIGGRNAVLAVLLVMVAGACTGGQSGTAASGAESIELTVSTFGDFGYDALFVDYHKLHPNITIKSRVTDFDAHHKTLITQLAAGRGAADIVAIEEQYIEQFKKSSDKFANLADFGALDLRSQWVDWKWSQGVADNGKFVLGLGTDMGGLAMCYRKDLLQKAGLPTDRDVLARLWKTWDDYARVGDEFTAKNTGAKFADSAGTIYASILNQSGENYFSSVNDSYIGDHNATVKTAFYLSANFATKGETAQVTPFTQEWNVAIKQGTFATMTCPAWLLEQIRDAAGPDGAGKWDVATVPGGGGNRGGSFLTVPKQSVHAQQAYELAQWLTAPAQQKRLFLNVGILSSEPAVYRDPEVIGKVDSYFSNSPTGKLFASSAESLRPSYRGVQDYKVRPVFGQALSQVEDGKQSVDAAWKDALDQAKDALK